MKRNWSANRSLSWTLAIPLLAALVLVHTLGMNQRLDYWLYDSMITRFPAPVADDLAVVGIDERSLDRIGRWPWPRSVHAELVHKLHQAGAEIIVFDILFPEPSPDDPALAAAMKAHGRVVLPLYLSSPAPDQLMNEQFPAPVLSESARLGHAHVELDADGLARGLYLFNGLGARIWPSLALAAYDVEAIKRGHSSFSGAAPYVNVRQEYVAVPLAGRAGTLPAYSYSDVLEQPPDTARFSDKVVFVGATAPGFGDILPTPFSSLANPMSGVEFHANSYSALVTDTLIRRATGTGTLALPIAMILLLTLLMPRLRPIQTLALCTGLATAIVLIFSLLLFGARLWLPVSSAILMPLLAFPLWTAVRLAMANRFLNRQLDELDRGYQLYLPEPGQRHPSQLLEHLRALLQPLGWWLTEDNTVLAANSLTDADRPAILTLGGWYHHEGQSWLRFRRGPHIYELGLKLPATLTREAARLYLQRLGLGSNPGEQEPRQSREIISARIDRVRQATERLNSMQAFIARSFEKMPDGVIVADALGIIRFVNSHIKEWFGEPAPSLVGMPLARLLQGHNPRETTPWSESIAETLTLQQRQTLDLQIRDKDFLVHFAPFQLPESHQNGIIVNISDITQLRAQQRQHREAIDFISHDVRSPLVSQMALIEQLKRRPGDVQPEQLEQLGRLSRRSYQLAEEFVQLARAEQLTATRFYECDLLAIAENARDSVSEQAAEKGIRLNLQGDEDLWLSGNAELLERAVINLLTNAVQYSEPGTTVTIQAFPAGHQAVLTVSDEGTGIAPDELPHLFDRFRRQRSSELSRNHGVGLGLSFVNVVVEKHRGEIYVVSNEGQGSTFTLKLPVAIYP